MIYEYEYLTSDYGCMPTEPFKIDPRRRDTMTIGMLWERAKKTELSADIENAANYYHRKYGASANLVHINPRGLDPILPTVPGVEIRLDQTIQPGYLWVGVGVRDEQE